MADWEDAPSLTKDQSDKIAKAGSLVTGDKQWEDAPSQYSKFMRDQSSPRRTTLEGVGQGAADPFIASAQIEAHLLPKSGMDAINWARGLIGRQPITTASVDKAVQDREARIQASRPIEYAPRTPQEQAAEEAGSHPVRTPMEPGVDTARLGGNLLATLPMAALGPGAGTGVLARIGGSAVAGGLASSLNPVTQGNFWTEKGKQAGIGAVTGGATAGAGRVLASTVMPTLRPAARLLVDEGVELTPGQMAGGQARRVEDAMMSVPVLGTAMRNGQRRSIETFNRAAINRALEPIGQTLPRGVVAGREAIEAAQQRVGTADDRILPTLQFRADMPFLRDMGNLRQLVSEMPPAQREQFENILRNRVGLRLSQTGQMDGQTFKQVESELTAMTGPLRASQDAAQRQLGDALLETRDILRDTLERSNPNQAQALQAVNRAYAGLRRVEDAASNRAGSGGVFTPNDLSAAVRRAARRSGNSRSFAAGNAAMQDLADAAQDVLPRTIPDSGTPERAMWAMAAGGGGVAAMLGVPHPALAAGAAMLPYTSPGMNLLRQYATVMPTTRNYIAQALRRGTPFLAAPAAMGANALLSPQAPQQ